MIVLRYWAAAKAAAGVAEDRVDAPTLAAALESVTAAHGDPLAGVLTRCSFLVDGDPVGGRARASVILRDGAVVEVLPPFAGG